MTSSAVGMTLTTAAGAGAVALIQSNPALSALDRLAEITPLVALLLVGLWILFTAYRDLVKNLMQVVESNTRALVEFITLMREIREGIERHDDRLDRLESVRSSDHRGHQGGTP